MPYIWVKYKFKPVRKINDGTKYTPEIYNAHGEKMKIWYIQDRATEHTPYSLNAAYYPQKILWDRFNYSLQMRFFGHDEIFHKKEKISDDQKDFALLIESESVAENTYGKLFDTPQLAEEYDVIYTCSERVLNRFQNAKFMPANGFWYGSTFQGGKLDPERYTKKTKNISLISSGKCMCEGHQRRLEVANKYKNSEKVDAFGSFGGRPLEKKSLALDDYRYSIAMENDVAPYYFTEKILDCFAAMVVPIYVGAGKINEFFNEDGIIQISVDQLGDLDKIISKCSEQDYKNRQEAIIDNYKRVQKYRSLEDYLLDQYPTDFRNN
jgi:hypothetical protein